METPAQQRLLELRTMPYEEYLQTPEWRQKREQALVRDNYCCRLCNSDERLHVHHQTYERRGNEDLEDLTTLCEECHERFHRKINQAESKIEQRYQRREFIERVRSVIKDNDIHSVNRLLHYGWRILAIEQYIAMDGYKETVTCFVLGHTDENARTY